MWELTASLPEVFRRRRFGLTFIFFGTDLIDDIFFGQQDFIDDLRKKEMLTFLLAETTKRLLHWLL